jgi:hypothetical protein
MAQERALGYFTFIEGIPGPFFSGAPSEATAFFTFTTARFLQYLSLMGM